MSKKLTKKQLKIQKRNADFAKLSKAEKRVAIAKDVLAQIAAGKYVAEAGVYVETQIPVTQQDSDKQVCDLIEGKECHVCALGSVFVSAVKFADKLTVGDVEEFPYVYDEDDPVNLNPFQSGYLTQFFSRGQLGLMECCFERGPAGDFSGAVDDMELPEQWGSSFEDDRDRLVAIMENVVRNGGTFKPVLGKAS